MASQGPGDHRRKWDLNKYERILSEEEEKEASKKAKTCMPPVKRDNLKARDFKVDLDSKLGRSVVLTKATPETSSGGYYCNVCDCIVKDSINFLDHINGKKHQRNLGMSMKIERSSADQVRQRFELNKQKKEEKKKEYNFEERMKELKEQEEREKALKKEKQKESKKRKHDEMNEFDNADNDMAAIMGFSGFSTSKKH